MAPFPISSTENNTGNMCDTKEEIIVRSPYPDIKPVLDKEIHELVFERIEKYGDLTAFTCSETGDSLTFHQFLEQAKGFGAALLKSGRFRPGDIAGILLPNSSESATAVFGCWSAGMIVTWLNPRYSEHETLRQFQIANVSLVISDPESLATILKAQEENPGIKSIVLTGYSKDERYELFHDLVKTPYHDVEFSSGVTRDPTETTAWLPFSSGTTGPPKLAILTHAMVTTNVRQFTEHEDVMAISCYLTTKEQERVIAIVPFFHIYGMVYNLIIGLFQGAHTVIVPRFRPAAFLQLIRSHKPTVLHLVTPLISLIVHSDEYSHQELESVKAVFAGGATIGTVLINKLLEKAGRFVYFIEAYGMTEVLATHILNPSTKNKWLGSCGRLVPSAIAKVIDVETGTSLGPNMKGEILLKTACPVKGYVDNPKATQELVNSDGWTHTGDIGYYNEENCFYIVDRIKELIKVNGFQVAPSELEDILRKHEKISDCAIVGIPSEECGEAPRAYIVPKRGVNLSESEVHAYLNPLVAKFKQLKGGVEITNEIPKSPSGKILRRELRAKYAKARE